MSRFSDRASATPLVIILALGFSSLCTALMQSLVIPLQGELPRLLSTSPSNAAWVVTATLLAGGVAMPLSGKLADLRGRKPVLVVSALLLLAGSLICAVSTTLAPVLVGRVLQGLAMGYIPVAISFVRETVPASMQNTAVAGISATLGVGGALGLPFAAWIAQSYDWHALFWVSTGLATVMVLLSALVLPHRVPADDSRLDVVGAIGLSVGVVAVLGGISKGGDWGWSSPLTLGAILGGAVVLVAWGFYETRHPHPLVDLRTSARRPILLTNLAALLIGFGMMAQSIVVPQLLQLPEATGYGLGQTMLQAGLWMAPAGLFMLVCAPISSMMLTRLGGRVTLAVGATIIAGGYLIGAGFSSAPWQLMLATCVASAGVGIGYAAMPTLIMENSPASEAGSGVGVNALMRSMGTTIAGAVMALVLTSRMTDLGGGIRIPAQDTFHLCFLLGAGAALVGAVVVLFLPRGRTTAPTGPMTIEAEQELAPAH
ncbi:MFS transporter [Dietzia sp. B32]|uniref:MFS transporter n=1 Tax=Dietzia sp. B32 TaxID=2915130 RepID=UPI0021AE0287|nr:MDR family MFS transporter [Dietzia sp. B32]UVE95837.1 MFS transporter [Dietzia sp. B32]